jgi:hypothetical protein
VYAIGEYWTHGALCTAVVSHIPAVERAENTDPLKIVATPSD